MTMPGRRSSIFTRLLRHGFTDPSGAEGLLDVPEMATVRSDPLFLDALGATADPDLALRGLVRLIEAANPGERRVLLDTLLTAKPLRDRLLGVLGASEALGDHLARHPHDWHVLVTYESSDLHPGVAEFERGLADATDPVSLRIAYRRCLLAIAARDVCGTIDIAQTAAELADLATATLRAALAIARAAAPEDAAACRARGHRDGQVRRARAELHLRRGRDLRGRPPRGPRRDDGERREREREPQHRRRQGRPGRHPPRLPPHAHLLRDHRRGLHLARRRQPPPRRPQRPPRPHPEQPPRLLPALGQDLGVPGPPQGPRRRRGRTARRRVHRRRLAPRLAGRRPRALRPRRAEDAPPRRGQHPRRPAGP